MNEIIRARMRKALSTVPFWNAVARAVLSSHFPGSAKYWEKRYAGGGDSGVGSYGELAGFKGEFLRGFLEKNEICSVIDFGCGDGNQISSLRPERYIGLDISLTAIDICRDKYKGDRSKAFVAYDPTTRFEDLAIAPAEMAMSLDVIFHLVEDDVFKAYIANLFSAALRFVVIYSSNFDELTESPHVRHRHFSAHIEDNIAGWALQEIIRTPDRGAHPDSEFFVYRRHDAGASKPVARGAGDNSR